MGAQAVRLSNVDIDNALENRDFEVLFQPIFDLGNGALARMETFVRWRHPTLGVLPPGAFISFFETQGRMSELTRYVLAEALNGYSAWRGPFSPGFSINLALTDVSDEAFAAHLTKVLRDREFPADLVTLECPMPPVDMDIKAAAANFVRLRETGARLAIEVRGRANDFLRTIDPFPFDEIKTGGASILRFARTVRGPGLSAISDLLDIANKANAVITAVGVEDQASLAALRGLGFTAAQGNHLGNVGGLNDFRPARVNEVRELLGLTALSPDDLTALFRTEAPAPKAAEAETTATEKNEENATLIERLHEQTEKETAKSAAAADADADTDANAETTLAAESAAVAADQAKRAKAREKAKALALAKRAKAREIRKAAAIKRAKEKVASARETAASDTETTPTAPFPPSEAPRALQDRLAQEYKDGEPNGEADGSAPAIAASTEAGPMSKEKNTEEPASQASASEPSAATQNDKNPAAQNPRENPFETPAVANERGAESSDANTGEDTVNLKVESPQAYFRPGIRVGGEAHIQDPAPSDSAEAAPDPSQQRSHDVVPSELQQQNQQHFSFEEHPSSPTVNTDSETTTPADPEDAIEQGHLQEEYAFDEKRARQAGQKSWLWRKQYTMPKHFWPKRWKRRYHQWQKDRAEISAHTAEFAD